MKKLFVLLLTVATFAILAGNAYASGSAYGQNECKTVYGVGTACSQNVSFTIDKLVQNPGKGGEFVNNLTMNDPLFGVNQDVIFQIKVKNTGDKTINNMQIVDTLPSELTFTAGPGSFDTNSKKLTINVDSLEAGKEAVYFVSTKVATADTNCPVNNVVATANGISATDNASFCMNTSTVIMEKPVINKVPATGPEDSILFSLPALSAAGFYLKKKAGL
ncbi:MAG TPA: hypothetical protein VHE53_02405 [Patescibacteria group bacterium]|nr:hypothetical protein [Patescibacteria group bacterium]